MSEMKRRVGGRHGISPQCDYARLGKGWNVTPLVPESSQTDTKSKLLYPALSQASLSHLVLTRHKLFSWRIRDKEIELFQWQCRHKRLVFLKKMFLLVRKCKTDYRIMIIVSTDVSKNYLEFILTITVIEQWSRHANFIVPLTSALIHHNLVRCPTPHILLFLLCCV